MLDAETVTFLESGCALIVATVDTDGAPLATHAWGLTIGDEQGDVRVLLDADDAATNANLDPGRAISITGADVPTLRSMQLKGHSIAIEPATSSDRSRAERYCDDFFGTVIETDGTPRALLDRLTPIDYIACTVRIDAFFNQTPGPGAGTSLNDEKA